MMVNVDTTIKGLDANDGSMMKKKKKKKKGSKKQTEIRIHTYPDLVRHVKNLLDAGGGWIIVEIMGPFYQWLDALWVYYNWSLRTRGPGPRIAHGIVLWREYGKCFNVGLSCISQPKDEVQKAIVKRKRQTNEKEALKPQWEPYGDGPCNDVPVSTIIAWGEAPSPRGSSSDAKHPRTDVGA